MTMLVLLLTTGLEKEAILFFMPLSLSPYTLLLQHHFFPLISAFNSRDGLRRKRETACRLLLSLQGLRNDDGDAVDSVVNVG